MMIPKYYHQLCIVVFSLLCCSSFVFGQQPGAPTSSVADALANTDANLFQNLYRSIEQIIIPPYDTTFGTPTEVILFEMPGLVVNRDEYDQATWSATGYQRRQPDAILAQFVDRLPYYTGPVFVDSGSRISTIWGNLMYQYVIPIVDDPVQAAKVDAARAGLANGTLITAYDDASAAYEQSFNQLVQFRSDCLAKSVGGVCSAQAVIYRERLKRKWFTLEVARRDIAAAEAKIIALQVQDMQNFFAEQLFNYASNERVDMGSDGFGQSFYQTFLTPSNFYKWWPATGITQYSAVSDGSKVTVAIPPSATIEKEPIYGKLTANPNGNYSYTANIGVTGIDTVSFSTPNVNDPAVTDRFSLDINIVGSDVLQANTAFVKVAASSVSASSEEKSFSSTLKTKFDASGEFGLFKASGGADTTNTHTRSSLTASGSSFKMSLEIARVAITRPWLDTSILGYYPVAIRAVSINGWSDGTITPADNALTFRFKVLPVAFIVGRNIDIEMKFTQYQNDLQTASENYNAHIQVSYGPVFSGSASASYDSNSRDYKESSHNTTNGISIRGPQIIGWVCTVLPPFPNADQATVRAWEADQVARMQLQAQGQQQI